MRTLTGGRLGHVKLPSGVKVAPTPRTNAASSTCGMGKPVPHCFDFYPFCFLSFFFFLFFPIPHSLTPTQQQTLLLTKLTSTLHTLPTKHTTHPTYTFVPATRLLDHLIDVRGEGVVKEGAAQTAQGGGE